MNKYILRYSSDIVDSPIIATTVLETGILINILRAKVDYDEAELIITILGDDEDQKRVIESLRRKGVEVIRLGENIVNDDTRCVDCGACIALCPTNALSFNEEWKLVVDGEKCIICGACIRACPRRSLSLQDLQEI